MSAPNFPPIRRLLPALAQKVAPKWRGLLSGVLQQGYTTGNLLASLAYFLIVPRSDVIELELSVDEALTYVISMGVASPAAPRRLIAGNAAPDA